MTRIIGGSAGGRRLAVPSRGTRPTSDRVREALFSSLESRLAWSDVHFLDLYAGSGAVGLEALSRGAASATLVENAHHAISVLRKNAAVVGGNVRILERSAALLGPNDGAAATVAFVDPPYEVADDALRAVLSSCCEGGWINSDTLVVLERSSRGAVNILDEDASQKTYGETVLWYGHISN